MTELELQDAIHTLYEGDTETPNQSDDDYLARRRLINAAVNRWEKFEGTDWNELMTSLGEAITGDKTTNGTDKAFDCPDDFVAPGSYVRLYETEGTSTYYAVIPSTNKQLFDNEDKNLCYFLGNKKVGFSVNFIDVPLTGQTISYEYYKTATQVADDEDEVEMFDPYFIVYFVVARLFQQDNRPYMAKDYFTESEARLQQMKVRNDMLPAWNQQPILDVDSSMGIGGFGV